MKTIQMEILDLRKLRIAREYRLYVIRDTTNIFYVGQSNDVVKRLRGHRGKFTIPPSLINEFIRANWPKSKKWDIDLYTLNDIPECASVDDAERRLIKTLHPCLNVKGVEMPVSIPTGYNRVIVYRVITQEDIDAAICLLNYDTNWKQDEENSQ